MYPTRLNLLSPKKRTRLRHIIFAQFIKNALESIVLILCVSGILLLGAQWMLENYFNDLTENIIIISGKQADKNLQIKKVNRSVLRLNYLQELYTLWTPIIAKIANSIPDGVTLSNLQLNAANKTYIFTGTAKIREDLLELQKKLEALEFVKSVEIPLSQLTEKDNVRFSIKAFIK